MPYFKCQVNWEAWGIASIEAENIEEAKEKFAQGEFDDIMSPIEDNYQADLTTLEED
jgi:hypothetical protein